MKLIILLGILIFLSACQKSEKGNSSSLPIEKICGQNETCIQKCDELYPYANNCPYDPSTYVCVFDRMAYDDCLEKPISEVLEFSQMIYPDEY